jgi:cytochrome b6-f complex iron-sulfur subunit
MSDAKALAAASKTRTNKAQNTAINATPSKDKPLSRRSFLDWLVKGSLAGSALLGLAARGRFISFEGEPSHSTKYDLDAAMDFPAGSRTPVPAVPAVIIHNDTGFIALSLVCPHLGCTVNVTNDGFACPCHNSHFLPNSSLRNGPASKPLSNMRMEVNDEGYLIVYTC